MKVERIGIWAEIRNRKKECWLNEAMNETKLRMQQLTK